MPTDETRGLLTTAQVAELLGIDRSRVTRLAASYRVGTKLGPKALVFSPNDVVVLRRHSTGKAGRPPKSPTTGDAAE